MPIHETIPNEPHDEMIGDVTAFEPPPPTPGSRLGPAAGVEISGTEGQPPDAAPPVRAEAERTPARHGPSHGAERVLDDQEIARFSPPTHGNRVVGTRTTGGFDNHPGQPDPDRLRIFAGAPPAETPGGATQDDPLAGFAAEPAPESGLLPPPATGRPPVR